MHIEPDDWETPPPEQVRRAVRTAFLLGFLCCAAAVAVLEYLA